MLLHIVGIAHAKRALLSSAWCMASPLPSQWQTGVGEIGRLHRRVSHSDECSSTGRTVSSTSQFRSASRDGHVTLHSTPRRFTFRLQSASDRPYRELYDHVEKFARLSPETVAHFPELPNITTRRKSQTAKVSPCHTETRSFRNLKAHLWTHRF